MLEILLTVLSTFSLPAPSVAGDTPEVVAGKLGAKLDDYLTRCAAFGFSGSVLVEVSGDVVLLEGYGLAEREQKRANTPDTIFDIGSLSKQFTATAILRLEQDGKLTTSDTLPKFLKDVPPEKSKITLYHLLTHTSGLPRAIDTVGSEMHDRSALIKAVLAAPTTTKPGEAFVYSNVGYDLLGAVVELASGVSFEDYLRTTLFAPAKMTSTGFRKDGKVPPASVARGYKSAWMPALPGSSIQGETQDRYDPSLATEGWYSWGLRGAGGVLTNVIDLRAWQKAIDGDAILNAAEKEKLFRPSKGNYACGWYVLQTDRGTPWIEHGGTTGNGFDCKFTRFPEEKALIIALGNQLGGTLPYVNLNLGKLVRGQDVEMPPAVGKFDEEKARAVEGRWEGPGDALFELSVQDGRVVLEARNEKALSALLPAQPKHADALLKQTADIVKGLEKDDFKALHAAEDKAQPLFFFDKWWPGLAKQRGPRTSVTVIGAMSDPQQGDATLVRVDYEKGAEILKLAWSGDKLVGTTIGPPYASRRVLQPTAAGGWIEFDLIASKVLAELKAPAADAGKLELIANGKSLKLTKSKSSR